METNQEILNRYLIFKKECIDNGMIYTNKIMNLFIKTHVEDTHQLFNDVKEWDLDCIPNYVDVRFVTKIPKCIKKHKLNKLELQKSSASDKEKKN